MAAVSAALGEQAWHTLTGADSSFAAELPAAPRYIPRQMRTASGSPYTAHQYLLEKDGAVYIVHAAQYPDDINVANPRVSLQGGLDALAKSIEGGAWASVEWGTRQGATAVDATAVRDGQALRSFSLLKGRFNVTLTYAGPPGTARSPDADRFVASLRLGP
jgi:hypothetical protein